MSGVSISYKGAEIASLDDSGTKTLLTQGKYCEDDIEVAYTKPSGGGSSWTGDITRINISLAYGELPPDVTMDFPNAIVGISSLLREARAANGTTEVTINADRIVGATNNSSITTGISNLEQSASNITILTLNALDGSNPETGSQFLYGGSIQRVLGSPLIAYGFGGTGTYAKFNSTSLREFYLVPNKSSSGGKVSTGVLEDASLVSVANALKGGLATAQTLTITNATTKAKCSAIVGTVSQVTEDGETYDFFTQDDSGTVTLADFITQTKGWTLA